MHLNEPVPDLSIELPPMRPAFRNRATAAALHVVASPLSGAAMSRAMIKAISPKPTRMCGAVRHALRVIR